MSLNWREEFDDDDNSIWEATSPFTTDSDPDAVPDIYWRLQQRLRENRIEWFANHDTELGGETGETWLTIEEAKASVQVMHDAVQVEDDGCGSSGYIGDDLVSGLGPSGDGN